MGPNSILLAAKRAPDFRGLLALLAVVLLAAGCDPPVDETQEAIALLEAGRFEQALERFERLAQAHPEDSEILFLYGVSAARAGQPSRATWPLHEARRDPKWAVQAGLELARAALTMNDPQRAIDEADAVLALEPTTTLARQIRAEANLAARHFDEALEDAELLLDQMPDLEVAKTYRLQALLGMSELEAVEEAFDELAGGAADGDGAEVLQKTPRLCAARAVFAKEAEQLETATTRFADCLERFPTEPVVLDEAAAFFDQIGRPDDADAALQNALGLEPELWTLRPKLAQRLESRGRREEAERLLLEWTELESRAGLPAAWQSLAAFYFRGEDFDACVEAWDRLVELLPALSVEQRFGYAESLLLAGHHDRALAEADALPEVYAELMRGRTRLDQGRPEEALAHFETGLRLWPNNAVARYLAAQAALQLGRIDTAISHFRESVRVAPEDTDAGLQLALLHEREGALRPAVEAVRGRLKARPDDADGLAVLYRAAARLGETAHANSALGQLSRLPGQHPRAIREAVALVAEVRGPAAAIDRLTSNELDLAAPEHTELLAALVDYQIAAGRLANARARVDHAIAAHPDRAELHALRGEVLMADEATRDGAGQAFERALALDPESGRALRGTARLAERRGDLAGARSLYARAMRAWPDDRETSFEAALIGATDDDVARRLRAHLIAHPLDARAAAALATRLREREGASDEVVALLRRAARFGAGATTWGPLTEVLIERGEADRAVEILDAARTRRVGEDPALAAQLARAREAAEAPGSQGS